MLAVFNLGLAHAALGNVGNALESANSPFAR